jgi:hypothetical protein
MLFSPLARALAHTDRTLDRFLRQRRRAVEKVLDCGVRKSALQHLMRGERIGWILSDHFGAAQQVGDIAQALALPASLRSCASLSCHGSCPPAVGKDTTDDVNSRAVAGSYLKRFVSLIS